LWTWTARRKSGAGFWRPGQAEISLADKGLNPVVTSEVKKAAANGTAGIFSAANSQKKGGGSVEGERDTFREFQFDVCRRIRN
jgi:hypothetical protein